MKKTLLCIISMLIMLLALFSCNDTPDEQECIHVEKALPGYAPTCKQTGLTDGSMCSVCNKILTVQTTIPTLPHTLKIVSGADATCKEAGLTEGIICTVCNTILAEQTEIPRLEEHTPVSIPGKEATCKEAGLTEGQKCSVCDMVLVEQVEIPRLEEHTPVSIPGKEATCKEAGLTEGQKCSVCDTVLVEQVTIEALEHTEEILEYKAPTCSESGLTTGKKCSVCGEILIAQEEISKTGHTEETLPKVEPGCESVGLTEGKKCSKCDMIFITQKEIPATGHTKVVMPRVEPSCESTGLTEGEKCSVCDKIFIKQEEIPAKGHTEERICTVCGYYIPTSGLVYNVTTNGYSVSIGSVTEREIYIPSSVNGFPVTRIESNGFSNSNITFAYIPDSVTSIGEEAFSGCSSLTSIVIPDSVTSIGNATFSGCFSLKYNEYDNAFYLGNEENPFVALLLVNNLLTTDQELEIHRDTKVISPYAFEIANISSIVIDSDNPSYKLVDDVLYSKNGNILVYYPTGTNTSFTIPNGVKEIYPFAFARKYKLKNISIPNSVTSIGDGAFYDCYKLVEVYNLSSLDMVLGSKDNGYIGYYAKVIHTSLGEESILETVDEYIFMTWEGKHYLMGYVGSDKELTLPESYNGNNYEIYQFAFYNNNKITKVTIPNSVTSIGDYAFSGCATLTSVTIPDSVTYIGEEAFFGCTSLTSVTIGNGVTSIGNNAFYGCSLIKDVHISNVSSWSKIDFANKYSNPLYYFGISNVSPLGNAYHSSKWNESSDSCTIIDGEYNSSYEFWRPSTTEKDEAVDNSMQYCGIEFEEGQVVKEIVLYIGSQDIHTKFTVKALVDGEWVILGEVYNTDAIVEESITTGASIGIIKIKLNSAIITDNIRIECSEYGAYAPNASSKDWFNVPIIQELEIISDTDPRERNLYINGKEISGPIILDDEIYSLSTHFYGCEKINMIYIPNNVSTIDKDAFLGCTSLKIYCAHQKQPDDWDDAWNSSGCDVTWGCYYELSYTEVEGGYSVTDCTTTYSNKVVFIPKIYNGLPVVSIGEGAFNGCSLTSIVISDSITSIGNVAFDGCYGLSDVYYEGTIEDWCNITFSDYASNPMRYAESFYLLNENNEWYEVTEITIPDSITEIKGYTFYGFKNLTRVTIPSGVTSIGSNAFYSCTSLTSIVIPDSVTSIGSNAFCECSSLTSVTIGKGIKSIGDNAFFDWSGRESLSHVYYTGTLEDWCNNPYDALMSPAEHLYMLNGNNEWYEVTEITIPDSITEIKANTFYGFDNLTKVTIPSGVTSIGENAFNDCTSLIIVQIPKSVTSIGNGAFYRCNNLSDAYYEGTIEDWCNFAFDYHHSNPMHYAQRFYMLNGNNEWYEVTEITIPEGVTEIKAYAFSGFKNLTRVTIPNSVTSIGSNAFYNCSSLTGVTIPDSVTSIGNSAFYGCDNLKYNEYYNAYYLGNEENPYLFLITAKDENITSCVINENTKVICNSAFKFYCYKLVEVYNLSSLDVSSYFGNAKVIIHTSLEEESVLHTTQDGYVFAVVSDNEIYLVDYIGEETELTLPQSYNGNNYEINQYAFYKNNKITKVTIPNGVTSVGNGAFSNCGSLTSIVIGSGVTSIGSFAFHVCDSLSDVYYEGTIEDWCNITFSDSSSNPMRYAESFYLLNENNEWYEVTEITIPVGVTEIKDFAFYGFDNLTEVTISSGVTSIGAHAFSDCTSLTIVHIPQSVTSIGKSAFYNCFSGARIFCEAEEQPSTWDSSWNPSGYYVFWGQYE